jgi:thioesterase domain-containing protein
MLSQRTCVVTLQPLGDASPVYLMHGWVGELDHMLALAGAFGPHRPVFGIDSTHLDARLGVAALAQIYADDILAKHPGGPIHLIGWSAGGWWAFATAGALLRRGADIGVVATLDSPVVPVVPTTLRRMIRGQEMVGRITHTPAGQPWIRHAAKVVAANLVSGQPPPRGAFLDELRRTSLKPLPVRVQVFCPPDQLAARRTLWRHYALGGVDTHAIFDDHVDFIEHQHAPAMAAALERILRPYD